MSVSILISEEVRDQLKTLGNMNDTYNKVIARALDCLAKARVHEIESSRLEELNARIDKLENHMQIVDDEARNAARLAGKLLEQMRQTAGQTAAAQEDSNVTPEQKAEPEDRED